MARHARRCAEQLASAGRGRRSASHAERARVAVSKGIASAIKKIAVVHPELGRHLKATIRTGYFCSYTPDPRLHIRWLGTMLWTALPVGIIQALAEVYPI